ncbi:thiamine-phosphate kinase [Paraferrimonas haliotis]|uniref:Thiamine-monophosphate kinase n=1 Tax=Paraferrimonas haliotis TaxID=2013866 RepID=A0AA37TJX9_9GAMM|nr:thiamine-phosphate kinase [Paraferrimonas haliotis]GLS82837.1 thiamine-monophosphate kinase [Paraferrimonas haliotis]
MKEFDIIHRYFENVGPRRKDVILGVGDDCAIVQSRIEHQIVVSCDTLVEGTHFVADMPGEALAHKAVVANLSDLASMGAIPSWLTLAIVMPEGDEAWLEPFSNGLKSVCDYYHVQLIGGDTCKGDQVTLSITIAGYVPTGTALTRSGARPGDNIYVTGNLGDSALGLQCILGEHEFDADVTAQAIKAHYYPSPRVHAGQLLRGIASACLDISDGLASDLGHLLSSSKVGALLDVGALPLSDNLVKAVGEDNAREMALAGGEDYELLFTVPRSESAALDMAMSEAGVRYTCIGQVMSSPELTYELDGKRWHSEAKGYQHFE